jgi:2-oxoisovalerate dehydrogenase E1 component
VESRERLRNLLLIRAGDLREERLLRQGVGWFQIPCLGHEALAAIAWALEPDDLLFLYYRDRALMQGRGVTPLEIARDQLATGKSSSAGRMMPLHGSYRRLGIFPPTGPTGSQCLPAVGAAWGVKLSGAPNVVLCTIGDASTRQGEFYEAVALAVQDRLPIVFVVEDNGLGISTRTVNQLPFRLEIFSQSLHQHVSGQYIDAVDKASREAIAKARRGDGSTILWIELDRLGSHTHSDDQRVYRSADEIAQLKARDPVELYAKTVLDGKDMSQTELDDLRRETSEIVDEAYHVAENEPGPDPASASTHLFGTSNRAGVAVPFQLGGSDVTMVSALNVCLREALDRIPNAILFGEDIEDPKGGVFGFTKGLSTRYPSRVVNSPLAEATIIGTAVGLAATGYRPVFELQFIDYLAPGFNQLLNQAATLRWRSNGEWNCPAIFYAPYGAYLPAGGTWHSQSNEGFWTHIPGLRVAVPSTPEDLVGLCWTALHEQDPTLLLIPKHVMRVRHELTSVRSMGFGQARVVRSGGDVTVVAWGNCLEIASQAADELAARCSVEIVDLISLVPCDWATIDTSLAKTGRLVVVNEDARTGCFGQTIISEMVGSHERFNRLLSPPVLVARGDVHIGFNPALEYAVLPDVAKVKSALLEVLR